jgi:hypothetical protein
MIDEVNVIYRQVGIHFSLGAPPTNVVDGTLTTYGLSDTNLFWQILDIMPSTNRLEVYFIQGSVDDDAVGMCSRVSRSRGLVVKKAASVFAGALVLAHEIGHFFGLRDIYYKTGNSSGDTYAELEQGVKKYWMYWDWNNGTGSRFYDPFAKQYMLIQKLLMYGEEGNSACDIPASQVYGKPVDGELMPVNVGRSSMNLTP